MPVVSAMVTKMEMWTEVREGLVVDMDEQDLKPERVQEWLLAWPAWSLGAAGRTIHRTREFPSADVAAQYGAFVTGLAGSLSLPVQVSILDGKVELVLFSGRQYNRHRYAPLTQSVLNFATHLG